MNNFVKTEPPFPPLFSLLRHNICIEEIKALMNYDQIFLAAASKPLWMNQTQPLAPWKLITENIPYTQII